MHAKVSWAAAVIGMSLCGNAQWVTEARAQTEVVEPAQEDAAPRSAPQEGLIPASDGQPGEQALQRGETALRRGDLNEALVELKVASTELPQSVNAQYLLADCLLKRGEFLQAVAQFKKVLALSPNHPAATQILANLAGTKETAARVLLVSKQLRDAGAYREAIQLLDQTWSRTSGSSERDALRLLWLECRLWNDDQQLATDAARWATVFRAAESQRIAAAIAALSLLQPGVKPAQLKAAEQLVERREEIPQPWRDRLAILDRFVTAAEVTRQPLADEVNLDAFNTTAWSSLPESNYRHRRALSLANQGLHYADRLSQQNRHTEAQQVVISALLGAKRPENMVVLRPITLEGEWLSNLDDSAEVYQRGWNLLFHIGILQSRPGDAQEFASLWFAMEVLRQSPSPKGRVETWLNWSRYLAGQTTIAPERQPGTPLSQAAELELYALQQAASQASTAKLQGDAVDQLLKLVDRYRQAKDPSYGISLVVSPGADEPRFSKPWDKLMPGAAQQKLWHNLASLCAATAAEAANERAASLQPNAEQLTDLEELAISLASQGARRYPENGGFTKVAEQVAQRWISKRQWLVVNRIWEQFYAFDPQRSRWARIHVELQQAADLENQRLAVNLQIGQELPESVKEALTKLQAAVSAESGVAVEVRAATLLDGLINRYVSLQRIDLANQLIEGITLERLADWRVWSRAQIAAGQAAVNLERARLVSTEPLTELDEQHRTELQQLNEILQRFPQSRYRRPAFDRVLALSASYAAGKSYDLAISILSDFAETHPLLDVQRQLAYRVITVRQQKAAEAFAKRNGQKPVKLSTEDEQVIKALDEFLAGYPTGDMVPAVQLVYFQLARQYGNAGDWKTARTILTRFAEASPDYRDPLRLQLLEAITYLGELDAAYGLAQLSPPEPTRVTVEEYRRRSQTTSERLMDGEESDSAPAGDPFGDSGASELPGMSRAAQRGGGMGDIGGEGFGGGGFGAQWAGSANGGAAAAGRVAAGGAVAADLDQIQAFDAAASAPRASEEALAMVRQAQQRQFQQLAMLESSGAVRNESGKQQSGQSIALPSGRVLSEAELKRQEASANEAYTRLLAVLQAAQQEQPLLSAAARGHILWMFGFFEGQLRPDHAIVLIERFLKDQPEDATRVALRFRVFTDRLVWAGQRQPQERVTLQWLTARHKRYEQARQDGEAFIKEHSDANDWVHKAQLAIAESFIAESNLAAPVSALRAGGLLVQASDQYVALLNADPPHPQRDQLPQKVWDIASRLTQLGQQEPAIYVLNEIPLQFPTHELAARSVLRIAELYAANLSNPLKAVEAYREFLSLGGDNEQVRSQVFSIAQQLGQQQRYLESLHVYAVFVESFPTDPRAAQALQAIGTTHQKNEAWEDAITTYDRLLEDYASAPMVPQVKLAVAECRINLSEWRDARRLYESFVQQYPKDGQVGVAQSRLTILKQLERYQTLLGDEKVDRNKDDAQYQIGRIVRSQLNNPIKAIQEFRKVVSKYPKSDVADDAQLEVGKALLSLGQLEDARKELLSIPRDYPNSPLADDALFLVGQSFEQQAQRIATVTLQGAQALAFERNQRRAYQQFNEQVGKELEVQAGRRAQLLREGKKQELAVDEAAQAFRLNTRAISGISNTSRAAEQQAETESALQVANRMDRVNEAYRSAVKLYVRAATDYPLGNQTDASLLRVAEIFETKLNDRAAAMESYQKIVKLFPGTPVAEDAAWRVAVFYEQEGKYTQAASAFREFIRNYPASQRVADAQFSLAEVLEELGMWVEAMDAYEIFRQKFSKHAKASLAQEQINWIKTYRK